MTRPPPTFAEPTASFVDALSGVDGTADPMVAMNLPQGYADPLADRFPEPRRAIELPDIPVVRIQPPSAKDFFSHDEPRAVLSGQPASSAERAEAARRAAIAKRDAAIAVRLRASQAQPGLAPAPRRGSAPVRYASAGHRQMPLSYVDPSSRQPAARRPTPRRPPAQMPTTQRQRKSGGVWGAILAIILFLLISGTGRQLLDAITELLNR